MHWSLPCDSSKATWRITTGTIVWLCDAGFSDEITDRLSQELTAELEMKIKSMLEEARARRVSLGVVYLVNSIVRVCRTCCLNSFSCLCIHILIEEYAWRVFFTRLIDCSDFWKLYRAQSRLVTVESETWAVGRHKRVWRWLSMQRC